MTLQVIPYSAGAHARMPGSVVLMDFLKQADPDVTHIGPLAGDLFLESEADLRRYRLLFEHLRAVASSPDHTTNKKPDGLRVPAPGLVQVIFSDRWR